MGKNKLSFYIRPLEVKGNGTLRRLKSKKYPELITLIDTHVFDKKVKDGTLLLSEEEFRLVTKKNGILGNSFNIYNANGESVLFITYKEEQLAYDVFSKEESIRRLTDTINIFTECIDNNTLKHIDPITGQIKDREVKTEEDKENIENIKKERTILKRKRTSKFKALIKFKQENKVPLTDKEKEYLKSKKKTKK